MVTSHTLTRKESNHFEVTSKKFSVLETINTLTFVNNLFKVVVHLKAYIECQFKPN